MFEDFTIPNWLGIEEMLFFGVLIYLVLNYLKNFLVIFRLFANIMLYLVIALGIIFVLWLVGTMLYAFSLWVAEKIRGFRNRSEEFEWLSENDLE